VTCPSCERRVEPMPNGRCPACKQALPEAGKAGKAGASTRTDRKWTRRDSIRTACLVLMVLAIVNLNREGSHGVTRLFDAGMAIVGGLGLVLVSVWPKRAD